MRGLKTRRQAGDTIVEVLIAIALVSLIITGAYVTANRSVKTLQDTSEHAQALKLVQAQIEFLRAAKVAPDKPCYNMNGVTTTSCTLKSDGSTAGATDTPAYNISVKLGDDDSACSGDTYEVNAKWDNLFGTTDSVTVCYRVGEST